jgi:hypothetical protein
MVVYWERQMVGEMVVKMVVKLDELAVAKKT